MHSDELQNASIWQINKFIKSSYWKWKIFAGFFSKKSMSFLKMYNAILKNWEFFAFLWINKSKEFSNEFLRIELPMKYEVSPFLMAILGWNLFLFPSSKAVQLFSMFLKSRRMERWTSLFCKTDNTTWWFQSKEDANKKKTLRKGSKRFIC